MYNHEWQSNFCKVLTIDKGQNDGTNDLISAVDQLLNDLGPKFSKVSSELFERCWCFLLREKEA